MRIGPARLRADIPALTGLRGVAALWVVGHHLGQGLAPGPNGWLALGLSRGFMAVDIFFVLSGFILTLVHWDLAWGGVRFFLIKRLLRVYPLDVAVMLLMLAGAWAHGRLGTGWYAWSSFAPVLLMVQPFLPGPPIMGWLITNWSVGVELLCYLLFPAILVPLRRLPVAWLIALAVAAGAAEWSTQAAWSGSFAGLGAMLRGVCGFGLGATLACLAWRLPPGAGGSRAACAAAGELVCLAGLLAAIAAGALPAIPLWSAGLIACLAFRCGPVTWVLATRPLVWLGEISFSIYLVHGPLLGEWSWPVLARLRAMLPEPAATVLWLVLFLAATLALSTATYLGVEQPGRRLAARLARSRPGRRAGPAGRGRRVELETRHG